jgi:hypothetical protein
MKLIATQTVTTAGPSITFSDIPQNFTDLHVLASTRFEGAYSTVSAGMFINSAASDTTSRRLAGNGAAASSGVETSEQDFYFGESPATNSTSNTFANSTIYIPNYTGSQQKSISADSVTENNGTTAYQQISAGLCTKTAPVTSLTFRKWTDPDLNFSVGTTISLYGIGGAGDGGPKATGGMITRSGDYWVHTFTASGTFTPTADLTCDYLVIAGGGGGGQGRDNQSFGGGGGAGGYRSSVTGESSGGGASAESKLSLTSGTAYTVTVGAGGAAGTQGANSVFGTITSDGGGRGGTGATLTGGNGGSGGGGVGGNGETNAGGTATTNQGTAGGSSVPAAPFTGGGGGAGEAGNTDGQTLGGDGLTSSITGSAVIRGGGGTGGVSNSPGGDGGGGAGGGAGGNGVAGTVNTGGGGGGGGGTTATLNGGAGGSGIVVVRYAA